MKKKYIVISFIILSIIMVAGCAKTTIKDRHELVTEKLPRPGQIWIYSFAASVAEIPENSALARYDIADAVPETPDHAEMSRHLGIKIAGKLVNQIHTLGMPARFGRKDTFPKVNDLVIRGYLISYDEGDSTKRILLGFGSGASDLVAATEGFQMTEQGLRRIGYGSADADGGGGPGADLGLLGLIVTKNPAGLIIGGAKNIYDETTGKSTVEGRAKQFADDIAEVMKERFQEQGWISKDE